MVKAVPGRSAQNEGVTNFCQVIQRKQLLFDVSDMKNNNGFFIEMVKIADGYGKQNIKIPTGVDCQGLETTVQSFGDAGDNKTEPCRGPFLFGAPQ